MRACFHLIVFLFVCLSASAHSVTEENSYYRIEHTWPFEGKQCSISLNISMDLYDYYQNDREHLVYRYRFEDQEIPPNYFSFILSENDRLVMQAVAREFSKNIENECDRISLALSFVQSLPYAFDDDSKGVDEYVRYPIETLVDGCGDCEDKVILLSALLYEMDVDFILLSLPEHIAVGVHCDGVRAGHYLPFRGKRYYYLETTTEGWEISQIPEDYQSAEMEAVPVDDTPNMLVKGISFESEPTSVFEKASCSLQVELHNLGPGKMTELWLHVRVVEKRKRNRLLAEEYYLLNDLQEGELRIETLSFKSLIREHCVLQVEIWDAEIEPQYYDVVLDCNRTQE